MLLLAPKKKLASIASSALLIALTILVIYLLMQVRTLYHDHLKLGRLKSYQVDVSTYNYP